MATLVIQLPARPRLGSGAATPPAGAGELAYVLTPDGINISRQGRTTPGPGALS